MYDLQMYHVRFIYDLPLCGNVRLFVVKSFVHRTSILRKSIRPSYIVHLSFVLIDLFIYNLPLFGNVRLFVVRSFVLPPFVHPSYIVHLSFVLNQASPPPKDIG